MKKEDLFEVLEDLDPEEVQKARSIQRKKIQWVRWGSLAACTALLVAAVILIPKWAAPKPGSTETEKEESSRPRPEIPSEIITVSAVYPEPVAKGASLDAFYESEDHWNWWTTCREKADISSAFQTQMHPFYQKLMEQMLVSENDNAVCSPLNIYIAFSMLAETTDGNSRAQILDFLSVSDMDTLRNRITALWESNYADTPALKCLLANSLWLRNGVVFNEDTLGRLADRYYASSYRGNPGTPELDEALQQWTDQNTAGLLSEYVKDLHLTNDTVMALISTIYYKAAWQDIFLENNTKDEIFHGTQGDQTVPMMHRTDMMSVYRSDRFTSLGLHLEDSGSMFFVLPDEGTNVNDLLSDPDLLNATHYEENDHWSFPLVNLAVPKFNVSKNTDLREILPSLGITDVLDDTLADFTPLTTDDSLDPLFLSQAQHAAMVEIDETGVTGAAYTELALAEGAAIPEDEIDFVLDRPFLFMVTGLDGSILFAGIIRNIP